MQKLLLLVFATLLLSACQEVTVSTQSTKTDSTEAKDVLDKVLERKKLVALVDNSTTSYFLYKGQPMGFEYELLEMFSHQLGVELEIRMINNLDSVAPLINSGRADLIAANLTLTKERSNILSFTAPLLYTRQVLVQRMPENYWKMPWHRVEEKLIRNPIELAAETVYVKRNSAFYSRLLNLSDEIGEDITILEPKSEDDTETLIKRVAKGEIDYTIADENIAKINTKYYPNIDIKTPISFNQKIAWATAKENSGRMLDTLNHWIKEITNSKRYAMIRLKYFKARTEHSKKVMSEYSSISGNRISKFDELFKKYAPDLGWDWRLLAALCFQESRFDPNAQSWAGAKGLMQLIPGTAKEYNLTKLTDPEGNVRAGVRYLKWIDDYWKEQIPDSTERQKFVLASYNVGLGHIIDAVRLADKYGANAEIWTDNVEDYILKKSKSEYYNDEVVKHGYCRGAEPYFYVKEIMSTYTHYRNHIKS